MKGWSLIAPVAIDGREHHVLEAHLGRRLGDALGLSRIELRGPPVGDRAVRAVSRTDVAEDHERRGAVLPALADVGAVSFLADGVEVELAHEVLESRVVRPAWRPHLEPARLSLWEGVGPAPAQNLVEGIRQVVPESESRELGCRLRGALPPFGACARNLSRCGGLG